MTLATETAVTQEHQDIARTVQEYIEQLNASNARAIVDLHTDDAAFFPPTGPVAVGSRQLTDAYEGAFAGVKVTMTNHIDTIFTDGDLAAVRSHSSGSITPAGRRDGHAHVAPGAVGAQALGRHVEDRAVHAPGSAAGVVGQRTRGKTRGALASRAGLMAI